MPGFCRVRRGLDPAVRWKGPEAALQLLAWFPGGMQRLTITRSFFGQRAAARSSHGPTQPFLRSSCNAIKYLAKRKFEGCSVPGRRKALRDNTG